MSVSVSSISCPAAAGSRTGTVAVGSVRLMLGLSTSGGGYEKGAIFVNAWFPTTAPHAVLAGQGSSPSVDAPQGNVPLDVVITQPGYVSFEAYPPAAVTYVYVI